METEEIQEQFNHILSDLKARNDLPNESLVQVAQLILQESGKDRRAKLMQNSKSSYSGVNGRNNNNNPATLKQKNALTRFGIKFRNDNTKSEAYELLNKAFCN